MWGYSCLPFHILISQLCPALVALTLPIVGTEHHTVPDLLLFHFRLFWRFLFQSLFVQGNLLGYIVNKLIFNIWYFWFRLASKLIERHQQTSRHSNWRASKPKKEIMERTENHERVKLRKDEIPGGSHARRALCCTCKWQMRESNLRWNGFSPLSFCHLEILLFLLCCTKWEEWKLKGDWLDSKEDG